MDFNLLELEKRIRELDLIALSDYKSGKAEPPILYKAQGLIKSAKDKDGMVFVASEESPDRYGDIIEVGGWNFENFKKNNVFMFNHDYHIAPIGTVPKIWVEGNQLLNTVDWDTVDELAKFIKGKYERSILKGESVGFRPLEWTDNKEKGYTFSKSELLEISAVALPAHPNAIRKALALSEARSYFFIPSNLTLEKEKPEIKMMTNEDMQAMKEKMSGVKEQLSGVMTTMDEMMAEMEKLAEEESDEEGKNAKEQKASAEEKKGLSEISRAIKKEIGG